MILRIKMSEYFYFMGALILFIAGIGFNSTAASGIGLYLLYSGKMDKSSTEGLSNYLKIDFVWNLLFLAVSLLMFFSATKVILNILLRQGSVSINQWFILIIGLNLIYFETVYRISLNKKNRFAVFMLVVVLISSAAASILGELWSQVDIILGFLSLTFIVIITFRGAYLELSEILLVDTHGCAYLPETNNRDNNAK